MKLHQLILVEVTIYSRIKNTFTEDILKNPCTHCYNHD